MTRRPLAALFAIVLFALPAAAQRQAPGTLVLGGAWKFSRGDAPAYAAPGFDDRGWGTVAVPGEWEKS